VTFRPFCAVIPLCAHALDDPEDKLRIPSSNISHVRFFIPSLLERLGSSTTLLTVKLVQPMIKPTVAMWHESMEILAKERIRGMNIGWLVGQTLPAVLAFRIENCRLGRLDKSLLSESADRRRRL
jgi:hypothetical protein